MPTVTVKQKIDGYISKRPDWQRPILKKLRQLIHQADPKIQEDWKWNSPAFSHNGLICFMWGFKNWVSITFFQGSVIQDKYKIFNAGEKNDRNRSIKLTDIKQINTKAIKEYIKIAVKNNLAGKKVDVSHKRRTKIPMPAFIQKELKARGLKTHYQARPPYQQNDYLSWIIRAKQESTRMKRLEKMLQELESGNRYMGMPYRAKKQKS